MNEQNEVQAAMDDLGAAALAVQNRWLKAENARLKATMNSELLHEVVNALDKIRNMVYTAAEPPLSQAELLHALNCIDDVAQETLATIDGETGITPDDAAALEGGAE